MKINFDNFVSNKQRTKDKPIMSKKGLVKLQVQMPEYDQFVRELSAQDFQSQMQTINSQLGWPKEMSKFLQNQITKQLKQSCSSSSIKVESPIYFMERTCSYNQILKKINKKEQPQKKLNMTKKLNSGIQSKFNAKLQKVFNYKKHKCKQEEQITSQAKKTLVDIKQLTCKPKLIPSNMSKKVIDNRKIKTQNLFIEQQSNSVFDVLYNEAKQRKVKDLMKVLQKQQQQVIQKPKINQNYFKNNNSTYTSIYNRLDSIMQARQTKRRQQQKYDLTEMRELFKPDIHLSQQSYKLISKSICKQTQQKLMMAKQRQNRMKKLKQKIEREAQQQKIKQTKKLDQKQLQLLLTKNIFTSKAQMSKQNMLDIKTIEHFTQIFFTHSSKINKSISNSLTKQQFLILQNFLRYVQGLQSKNSQAETTISRLSSGTQFKSKILSRQEFQQKFRKFYDKLSLYDRQILRKEMLKQNKSKQEKNQHNRISHKPKINARSSSLDNIAEGHSKHIYFV